jgi:peptidoglycan/LPS O-acetylase OafA/YrhL
LAALVVYFLYIADGWYCAMFVAGMLLCNLDLLLQSTDSLPRWIERLEPYKTFICYHLLVVSVYLGGVPGQNADVAQLSKNRGWYYLAMLKPQAVFDYKWFYLFWAATLLVGIVAHIRWLKRFFETSFCQYLGRVSYALYLVHGPVLWTVGERLYTAVGWVGPEQLQHLPHWADKLKLPRTGPLGLEISFLVPQLVLLPLTLGVASFVTRVVDKPCVRFASWLYTSTLSKGPGRPAKGLS